MSYLDPVRLHFAGQYQADPSTVNNLATNYDSQTFDPANGLWNPDGSGAFRLVGCVVTRVCYRDGTSTIDPAADPVVGMRIADANQRVAGKLVDLDPEQQMVSQIWGLIVRLTDGTQDFFGGSFQVAPFTDLWLRTNARGSTALSAFYQSVVRGVTWGDCSKSRFLRELRESMDGHGLSMKFNVDGYNSNSSSPTFTLGRLAGTIGAAHANEPHHFILGRHLGGGKGIRMRFTTCVVDAARHAIVVDIGNALETTSPGGPIKNVGDVALGYLDSTGAFQSIGSIDYTWGGFQPADGGRTEVRPTWYTSTAGVVTVKANDDQLKAIASARLAVSIGGTVAMQENLDGLYARADNFVYRLYPGEKAHVDLYVTQYGHLLDGGEIVAFADPSGLQAGTGDPAPATPADKIGGFDPKTPIVAKNGRATLTITSSNPGNPRVYIDGQVYGVRPLPKPIYDNQSGAGVWISPWDFVSLLLWTAIEVPDAPTWYGDVETIFQQYGNLYPLMDTIIDLTSYEAVVAGAGLLTFAFRLPLHDPNSMPVTRDLSPAKREMILRWLANPLRGTPTTPITLAKEAAPRIESAAPLDELFVRKSGRDAAKKE